MYRWNVGDGSYPVLFFLSLLLQEGEMYVFTHVVYSRSGFVYPSAIHWCLPLWLSIIVFVASIIDSRCCVNKWLLREKTLSKCTFFIIYDGNNHYYATNVGNRFQFKYTWAAFTLASCIRFIWTQEKWSGPCKQTICFPLQACV